MYNEFILLLVLEFILITSLVFPLAYEGFSPPYCQLHKRLEGTSTNNHFEDLNAIGKITSDYYTQEEILQFKKP